ncbi:MAG: hypothetical protein FWD11_06485 [Micrococcales bacterium]|nr:hypothetical protein [Micrococcales bacterium]
MLLVVVATAVTIAASSVFRVAYLSSERVPRPQESRYRALRNGFRRRPRRSTWQVDVSLAEMIASRGDDLDQVTPFAAFDLARQMAVEQARQAAALAAWDMAPEVVAQSAQSLVPETVPAAHAAFALAEPQPAEAVFPSTMFFEAGADEPLFPSTGFAEAETAEPLFPASEYAGPDPADSLFPTSWLSGPEPIESLFPATMFEQVESDLLAPTPGQGSLFGPLSDPEPADGEPVAETVDEPAPADEVPVADPEPDQVSEPVRVPTPMPAPEAADEPATAPVGGA